MTLHRLAQADWNHVCNDGLPELAPAEEVQRDMPLDGVSVHWSLYAMAAALCFILTIVGVNA